MLVYLSVTKISEYPTEYPTKMSNQVFGLDFFLRKFQILLLKSKGDEQFPVQLFMFDHMSFYYIWCLVTDNVTGFCTDIFDEFIGACEATQH